MNSQVGSLYQFLEEHKCIKGQNMEHLHIQEFRINNLNIYAGAYVIPDEDMDIFKRVYCEKVFKKSEQEFLTEAQLPTAGPILIDLDFRYDVNIEERQHTADHVMDTVELYLEQLRKIVNMTDETFPVFVLEKPNVNTLEDVTKDGIHIVIGIHLHHEASNGNKRRLMLDEIDNV